MKFMENKGKLLNNPVRFTRILGAVVGVILLIFEGIICAQYIDVKVLPALWKILSLIGCMVALDVLCFVELYLAKTLRVRIVIYCFDFIFLLLSVF